MEHELKNGCGIVEQAVATMDRYRSSEMFVCVQAECSGGVRGVCDGCRGSKGQLRRGMVERRD